MHQFIENKSERYLCNLTNYGFNCEAYIIEYLKNSLPNTWNKGLAYLTAAEAGFFCKSSAKMAPRDATRHAFSALFHKLQKEVLQKRFDLMKSKRGELKWQEIWRNFGISNNIKITDMLHFVSISRKKSSLMRLLMIWRKKGCSA